MKTKLFFSYFLFLFLSLSTYAQVADAAPNNDPVQLLQYIADNMVQQLKVNKATLKTKPSIVYSLAKRYVVPYADLTEMSRRVLPRHIWNSASAAERAQFQREFTTLLIRTYASALTSYQDQVVQFYPVRGGYQGRSTVEVASVIHSSSTQSIQVTYRLMRTGSGWKLYDMSVEGVSLIESFRSQFADILSSGSMRDLLNRLSSHNNR